jgi:hypothetical protein
MLSSICTDRYSANNLIKSHGSIRVLKMWCGIPTDLVHRCFVNPDGLSCGALVVGMVLKFVSWLTV